MTDGVADSNQVESQNRRHAAPERGMMYTITRAEVADAVAILSLQKLAYQSEAILYGDWTIPPLTQTLEQIENEFAGTIFLKMSVAGKMIGNVRGSAANGTCTIGRLIVHPDFQGSGRGTALMNAIEQAFPSVVRFELFTGSKSEANIRLYERLGYRIFRKEKLSPGIELVFMEKLRS